MPVLVRVQPIPLNGINMAAFETRDSGLVVPRQPQQHPERKWKPLELRDTQNRREVQGILTQLLNMGAFGRYFGMKLPDMEPDVAAARQDVLLFVAGQLLGDDFAWEDKC